MRSLTLTATLLVAMGTSLMAQAPAVEYQFNLGGTPTDVLNSGTFMPGLYPITGQTLLGGSPDGTSCLQGTTGLSEMVATPLVADQGTADWTVSFAINTVDSFASVGTNNFQYVFGAGATSAWRVFVAGVAGTGNIIMRANGMTDVILPGGGGTTGWVHVAWVHDSANGVIDGYVDGALVASVPNTPNLTSLEAITVGAYGGSTTSLLAQDEMDCFQFHNRALTGAEIQAKVAGFFGPPQFSTNSAELTMNVNGVNGGIYAAGSVAELAGNTVNFAASSSLGFPAFDIALSGVGAVGASSGGVTVAPGVFVNVDFTNPIFFLNGGPTAAFAAWPGAGFPGATTTNWNVNFTNPAPGATTTLQGVCADPASPLGFQLSQASEVNWN